MTNTSKVQLINNDNEKILDKGTYNIQQVPVTIIVYPKTRLQLFALKDMNGYNVIIDNIDNKNKTINVKDLLKSKAINTIKSIYVMSNVCSESKCGEVIEGFSRRDISDSCHYLCSSMNFQNVLICIIFTILVYYLVTKYVQK